MAAKVNHQLRTYQGHFGVAGVVLYRRPCVPLLPCRWAARARVRRQETWPGCLRSVVFETLLGEVLPHQCSTHKKQMSAESNYRPNERYYPTLAHETWCCVFVIMLAPGPSPLWTELPNGYCRPIASNYFGPEALLSFNCDH